MGARRHEAGSDAEGLGHFANVNVAPRIHANVVWRDKVARGGAIGGAPPGDDRAIRVEDAHPTGQVDLSHALGVRLMANWSPKLGDVEEPVAAEPDVGRSLNVGPRRLI